MCGYCITYSPGALGGDIPTVTTMNTMQAQITQVHRSNISFVVSFSINLTLSYQLLKISSDAGLCKLRSKKSKTRKVFTGEFPVGRMH